MLNFIQLVLKLFLKNTLKHSRLSKTVVEAIKHFLHSADLRASKTSGLLR